MFPIFLKRTAGVLAPRVSVVFRRFVVWVVFRHAGDRLMAPIFRRVQRLSLLPTTEQFP